MTQEATPELQSPGLPTLLQAVATPRKSENRAPAAAHGAGVSRLQSCTLTMLIPSSRLSHSAQLCSRVSQEGMRLAEPGHTQSGQGSVSFSVQAVVKGISRGSIGRKGVTSPGRPPPSLGICGEDWYLEPHKDLQGGWLPLRDNCQRGAWNRTESACCPISFFCFTSSPSSNPSWACVGFRFGLTLVLAEPVHLFRLRGCPNNIWAYFA